MNQSPVSIATLRVLLTFARIVQRKFHIMKATYAFIIERRDAMLIRSDCELPPDALPERILVIIQSRLSTSSQTDFI